MLKAIIIDDEPDAIEGLSTLLEKFVEIPVKVTGTAKNLDDGIDLIRSNKPDIVFLDIEMPNKNGMSIYNTFPDPKFKIIFTTAYQEYAIEALKKEAIDYLLKPIDFIELGDAIKKVKKKLEEEQKQLEIEDRVNQAAPVDIKGENIVLPVSDGFEVVNTKNIEYLFADHVYSIIVLYSGSQIMISKPLKELLELLPAKQFYRTHKSYAINVFYTRKFVRTNNSHVILRSGKKIPVAVRNVSSFSNDIQKLLSNEV